MMEGVAVVDGVTLAVEVTDKVATGEADTDEVMLDAGLPDTDELNVDAGLPDTDELNVDAGLDVDDVVGNAPSAARDATSEAEIARS